ncbi:NAD-dependent epimerase/dehydratase family protein [Nonomuraea sp. NPDC059007]|uniref:NAD-dependent epimerase/dehydratase family protein n=1 Tax=Nonomuraea sp. NPDC059007 TaxID=3346692 RepID=UPI0036895BFD
MRLGKIVLTGAAGRVGAAIRDGLRARAERLVLVDRVPIEARAGNEEVVTTELDGLSTVLEVVRGADVVVHLSGIPDEAPLPDLLQANVLGTHHVFEAARLTGVPRVVLAGSNRLTGHYPVRRTLTPDLAPRPDGLYGVSKAAVEALAHLYADKFGLQIVSLRIGSLETEPEDARHLATWLSPRDCAGYFAAALTTPVTGFVAGYAVSANARRFWELPDLGYTPLDNAEAYAARFPGADAFFVAGMPQGGSFAAPAYTLPHLR